MILLGDELYWEYLSIHTNKSMPSISLDSPFKQQLDYFNLTPFLELEQHIFFCSKIILF